MTRLRLIWSSWRHHGRIHAALACGTAIATAILVGAMLMGDSVDYSLRETALARLGQIHYAVNTGARLFTGAMAKAVQDARPDAKVAAVLQLNGMALTEQRTTVNRVNVLGVGADFWKFTDAAPLSPAPQETVLNAKLAAALGVQVGQSITLRVARRDLMSRDAPLSSQSTDELQSFFVTVKAIATDEQLGRFSLSASQAVPCNAFVDLKWLQEQMDLRDQANMLLAGDMPGTGLTAAIKQTWEPEFSGVTFRTLPSGVVQIESSHVYLEREVGRAALELPGAQGTLTYLVNSIAKGERATPYSFAVAGPVPNDLGDDEALINRWTADQLEARPGDTLDIAYFEMTPSNAFVEKRHALKIRGIVAMDAMRIERELAPAFAGLTDIENCADWKVSLPMDDAKLKDPANEAYWKEYRQTPKLLVSLKTGQAMWKNRFGDLMTVRVPGGPEKVAEIRAALKQKVDPAAAGFRAMPVREQALDAVAQAIDFGGLFVAMSFMLIVSALLLLATLFIFFLQQRTTEMGILLALGYTRASVRILFLLESLTTAVIGTIAGAGAGVCYARGLVYALCRFWQGAIGGATVSYHGKPFTILASAGAGFIFVLIIMTVTLWRRTRSTPNALLSDDATVTPVSARQRFVPLRRIAPWAGLALALMLALSALLFPGGDVTGMFFGTGALVLMSGLGLFGNILASMASKQTAMPRTLRGLAFRQLARRRARSLTVITLMAFGSFLVFAVGSMQEDLASSAGQRSSGTGGFALYAESTAPLTAEQVKAFKKNGADAVPLRVHDGDDASCLNLNHAQSPRIIGVPVETMATMGVFAASDIWNQLQTTLQTGGVPTYPALAGDSDTAMWGLKKKTGPVDGDFLAYTAEDGREVRLKLVGTLPQQLSVFQGSVLVSEETLTQMYPSDNGFRTFLIDVPGGDAQSVAQQLNREFERFGLEAIFSVQRLQEFHVVISTYLAMFLALGGFGLLLGAIGAAVLILRNLVERRGETAMLNALGYTRPTLLRILVIENGVLLGAGIALGLVASIIAIAPTYFISHTQASFTFQAVMFAAVLGANALCAAVGIMLGLDRNPLAYLRNE